jgi:hypothetical protein
LLPPLNQMWTRPTVTIMVTFAMIPTPTWPYVFCSRFCSNNSFF